MSEVPPEPTTASGAPPVRSVDLEAVERGMRAGGGADLTEVKEAIVDALLGLALNRCSGAGHDGTVIYGMRPSSRFVSGFLLPRFDETGLEDETSDIRIATMGVDFQLAAEGAGDVVVRPEAAIYVRQLPTWDEIIDPRHEMMPQVQLSRQTRQEVERRARDYIAVAIGALPQFEDDEPDERPGDAMAEAEQARETADAAEDASAEQGGVDIEARGVARATAQAAQRAEAVAQGRRDLQGRRTAARRERISAIATIRREAFDRAFAELGIRLMEPGQDGAAARPVASTDLVDDVDDVTAPENGEPAVDVVEVPEETAEDGPQPAAGAVGALRPGVGRIDDHHAAPQPIPQKWRRLQLTLGEFSFDPTDEASMEAASSAFSARLMSSLSEGLGAWLATQDGQDDAYRPGERILPSHFATRESWDAYLFALRARRPASEVDVRPDLNGVALVIDADADFVDSSRLNLSVCPRTC